MKSEYNFKNYKKNPYVRGLKTFCLCLTISLLTLFITACGGPAPVDKNQIQTDLTAQLKENYSDIDTITNLEIEKSQLSQSDKEFISSKYENIDISKYDVSFEATSLSENIKGFYSILYANIKDKWTVADCYEIKTDEWTFAAKDVKPSTQILEDLGDIKFSNFEQGYVGRNENTSIEIKSRNTNLEKGTDTVNASLTVKTSFSKYTIDVELKYIFQKGKWLLDKYTIADESSWKIEYIDDNMPKAVSPDTVFTQLTNESYFLSYCINKNYLSSYNIKKVSENTDTSSISFVYKLTTTYNNIGTFTYTITIPYEWNDQWVSKEIDIKITDIDISAMQGVDWISKNGEKIKFSNLKSSTANAYTNPDVLVGVMVPKDKEEKEGKNIELQIKPSKTDNNWEAILFVNGKQTDTKCTINLKDKTLICDSNVFSPQAKKVANTKPATTN